MLVRIRKAVELYVVLWLAVFCLHAGHGAFAGQENPARAAEGPVSLIFDSDFDSDVDDVGALALLHALADMGQARILAVILTTEDVDAAACADAINTYFGRPDLPVGVCRHQKVRSFSRYTKAIAGEFAHDLKSHEDAEDGVELYRRILAAEPDGSVTIVTVGHLTNLKNLLASGPDEHSRLSGLELVAKKVKLWSCMGGRYPSGKEPNFYRPDPESTAICVGSWPTAVVFSGGEIGDPIKTGGALLKERASKDNPVRRSYELYNQFQGRSSWDQTAVLYAVRGEAEYWSLYCQGYNHVFADGSNEWRSLPERPHAYLVEKMKPVELAKVIDELMLHSPGR